MATPRARGVRRTCTLAPRRGAPWMLACLMGVTGLALAWGGLGLLRLHGSPCYLLIGVTYMVCGLLLWRGRRSGAWLYGAAFAGTLLWSLSEVGLDAWALLPRLSLPVLFGLPLLLPGRRRSLQ